jgi:hypothetical protein
MGDRNLDRFAVDDQRQVAEVGPFNTINATPSNSLSRRVRHQVQARWPNLGS